MAPDPINPVLDDIYASGTVRDAVGNERPAFPTSLSHADGKTLYDLVRNENVQRSLEIGMALGVSSLFILQALRENGGVRHIAIDPFQREWFNNIGPLNVERAGFGDLFRFLPESSHTGLARLIGEGAHFDFIFIDGNHRFEHTLVDFFLSERLLRTGGHVMLHDPWLRSVRKAAAFILRNRADAFEPAAKYLDPPPSARSRALRLARFAWNHPLELATGLALAPYNHRNCFVFRKTADHDEQYFAEHWDDYRSF